MSDDTSLLDDLAAAWDDIDEETTNVEIQQHDPVEQTEDAGITGERSEDAGADAETAPVVSDGEKPGAEGVAEPADSEKPPVGLSPQAREDWKNTPESVRKELAKREADFEKGIVQYSQNAKRAQMMDQQLQPFQQLFAMNGGVGNTLPGLLTTASQLQMGAPAQKAQAVASLIKQFGVDIRTLDSLLVGEKPAVDPNQQVQQLVDQRFEQENQRRQQYELQQQQIAMSQKVQEFSSNPANEFYADLSADMADLMDMAANRGQPMDMQQAYDKAAQMHPQISQILAARNSQGGLQNKRRAASSVSGSLGGPGGASAPDSTRAALEDAWDNAGQM